MAEKPTYEELEKRIQELEQSESKRKHAEKALRQSEKKFRTIAETALDSIFLKDKNQKYSFVNPSMLQLLGGTESDLIGKVPDEVFDKENAAIVNEVDERTLNGEKVSEVRSLTIDGKPRTFHTIQVPLGDSVGNILGISGIVRDISDFVQAEEALRDSEERFRLLAEGSFEAIVIHEDGVILDANSQYYEMFGYDPAELAGKDAVSLTATPESVKTIREQVSLGNLGPYEATGVKKDGTEFPIQIRINLTSYKRSKARMAVIRDITERRRAEAALRESEEKYRTTLRSTPDTVTISRVEDGVFLELNDGFTRMFGYSREEALGRSVPDLGLYLLPADRHRLVEALTTKEEVNELEFTYRRKDETLFEGIQSARPIRYGGEDCLISVVKDISSLKKVDKSLRESEERYRLIAENVADVIWTMDMNLNFTYISPSIYQQRGYTVEEAMEHSLDQVVIPDSLEKMMNLFAEKMSLIESEDEEGFKPVDFEVEQPCKDGSTIWTSNNARILPGPDKQPASILGITRDITERKQAEETLLESKEQILSYSKQVELFSFAAASMLTTKDEQEFFNSISKAIVDHSDFRRVIISIFKDKTPFRDIVGFGGLDDKTIDKLRKIEMPKSWYDGVFQEGEKIGRLSYYIPHTKKQILNQEATVFGEGPAPVSDENWHPEDNLFVRMDNQKGEFIGVISVDESKSGLRPSVEIVRPLEIFSSLISQIIVLHKTHREQKSLEAQLRQTHKMESIGTLTGGIAHDFNNIMGIIVGNTELALDDTPEWNPVHFNLSQIKDAGLRAAGIVKQLLSFSRKTDHELKPIGAITVIKDALKFLRSTIPTTVEIRKYLPDTDVTIFADPIQINQVMMNILTNASHAIEETGGLLEITVETEILTEDSVGNYPGLTAGEHLKITISDTGPGIDPAIMARIFDPYFTTKEVGKGSGMGLAVVLGIINNHNGTISVDSEPGKGTTFTVLFPVVDEKPEIETKTPGKVPLGNETILFVDDEKAIAQMTGQMLERLGYKVETKLNPVEALDLFKSRPREFDLVITDMTMPQMTGSKLSEKLKDIRPDIPVMISTGHSSLIDEEKAKAMGIDAYIMKPIIKSDIAIAIRNVLDKG